MLLLCSGLIRSHCLCCHNILLLVMHPYQWAGRSPRFQSWVPISISLKTRKRFPVCTSSPICQKTVSKVLAVCLLKQQTKRKKSPAPKCKPQHVPKCCPPVCQESTEGHLGTMATRWDLFLQPVVWVSRTTETTSKLVIQNRHHLITYHFTGQGFGEGSAGLILLLCVARRGVTQRCAAELIWRLLDGFTPSRCVFILGTLVGSVEDYVQLGLFSPPSQSRNFSMCSFQQRN